MTKRTYIVGTNMPGYMPDSEPATFTSWRNAHNALLGELQRDLEQTEKDSAEDRAVMATIERAEALARYADFGETVNNRHYWLTRG